MRKILIDTCHSGMQSYKFTTVIVENIVKLEMNLKK